MVLVARSKAVKDVEILVLRRLPVRRRLVRGGFQEPGSAGGAGGRLRHDGRGLGGGRGGQHHLGGTGAEPATGGDQSRVFFLMAMHLRGVRESGKTFALPTYLFIAGVIVMVAVGLGRAVTGAAPVAERAGWQVRPEQAGLTGPPHSAGRARRAACSASRYGRSRSTSGLGDRTAPEQARRSAVQLSPYRAVKGMPRTWPWAVPATVCTGVQRVCCIERSLVILTGDPPVRGASSPLRTGLGASGTATEAPHTRPGDLPTEDSAVKITANPQCNSALQSAPE